LKTLVTPAGSNGSAVETFLFEPKLEKIVLFLLATVQFCHIMDFMILMPLGPQLMRMFSIGPTEFGWLVSAYTVAAGVSGFIVAFVIDRFDRKLALLIMFGGFVVGTIACALAPSYELLLAARLISGAFGGVQTAIVYAIIGDTIPEERRATAMGVLTAAFSAASVFGVPFGLFIASITTWHAPFWFMAGIATVFWILILKFVPRLIQHMKAGDRPSPKVVVHRIVSQPHQVHALFFIFFMMIGHFTVIPFISPYLVKTVGFKDLELTYVYMVGGALTIFTSPWIGRWADRVGKPRVYSIMAFATLLPILLLTHMPPVPVWQALIVTAMFFVFSSGRMVPAMSMLTSSARPQNRGSFMSVVSSLQQVTAGIAALIGGMIVQENAEGQLIHYNYVGYCALAGSVVAIYLGSKMKTIEQVLAENAAKEDTP